MGLDISLLKPEALGKRDPNTEEFGDNYYTYNVEHLGEAGRKFEHLAFDRVSEFYDVEAGLKAMGYDYNEVKAGGCSFGKDTTFFFYDKDDKKIDVVNPPTFKKSERVILLFEEGYQRKGANKAFYTNGMWDSEAVISKQVLEEHWNRFFSGETEEAGPGSTWGHGVEFKQESADARKNFKKNILDKFVEGQHMVMYH